MVMSGTFCTNYVVFGKEYRNSKIGGEKNHGNQNGAYYQGNIIAYQNLIEWIKGRYG